MAEKDKRSSASFVPFKPLDNLFEPTIQEKPVPGDSLQNLPLDDLHAFKDHPFRLYTEDKMAEMVHSGTRCHNAHLSPTRKRREWI